MKTIINNNDYTYIQHSEWLEKNRELINKMENICIKDGIAIPIDIKEKICCDNYFHGFATKLYIKLAKNNVDKRYIFTNEEYNDSFICLCK